jgi:uncharacterized protein YceK
MCRVMGIKTNPDAVLLLLADSDGCGSIANVTSASESLPSGLAAAQAMNLTKRQARLAAEARAADIRVS